MKVFSEWDDPQHTVILTVHERDWNWDELHHHNETTLTAMANTASGPLSMIVDMVHSPYFSPGSFMQHVQRSSQVYDALGIDTIVFVIHEKDIGTLLVSAYDRFRPQYQHSLARSLDAARDLIHQSACR